jgi:hypothetical protein
MPVVEEHNPVEVVALDLPMPAVEAHKMKVEWPEWS